MLEFAHSHVSLLLTCFSWVWVDCSSVGVVLYYSSPVFIYSNVALDVAYSHFVTCFKLSHAQPSLTCPFFILFLPHFLSVTPSHPYPHLSTFHSAFPSFMPSANHVTMPLHPSQLSHRLCLSMKPSISFYRNYGKTFKESRSSYGKGFLDAELKFIGGYELRCKRELWSVQMSLAALQKYFSSLMRRTLSRLLVVEVFLGE